MRFCMIKSGLILRIRRDGRAGPDIGDGRAIVIAEQSAHRVEPGLGAMSPGFPNACGNSVCPSREASHPSKMRPSERSVALTEDGKSRDDRNRADVALVTAGETAIGAEPLIGRSPDAGAEPAASTTGAQAKGATKRMLADTAFDKLSVLSGKFGAKSVSICASVMGANQDRRGSEDRSCTRHASTVTGANVNCKRQPSFCCSGTPRGVMSEPGSLAPGNRSQHRIPSSRRPFLFLSTGNIADTFDTPSKSNAVYLESGVAYRRRDSFFRRLSSLGVGTFPGRVVRTIRPTGGFLNRYRDFVSMPGCWHEVGSQICA